MLLIIQPISDNLLKIIQEIVGIEPNGYVATSLKIEIN